MYSGLIYIKSANKNKINDIIVAERVIMTTDVDSVGKLGAGGAGADILLLHVIKDFNIIHFFFTKSGTKNVMIKGTAYSLHSLGI